MMIRNVLWALSAVKRFTLQNVKMAVLRRVVW